MKCYVCKIKEAKSGSTVCSERCHEISLLIRRLADICTPTPGCENCLGDLHQGCTDKCRSEFKLSYYFVSELYKLVRTVSNQI
jgi:hypothetical protein